MNEKLKLALEQLPDYEQDAVGEWLLKLIENDEREWDVQFSASADKLEALADRALAEYLRGQTEPLDLEKLSKS